MLPGKYKLLVTGLGKYAGKTRYVRYTVEKADMSKLIFSGADGQTVKYLKNGAILSYNVYFNGTDVTGMKLVKDRYTGNKKTGTASLTIKPAGKYTVGTAVKYDFTVAPADIAAENIALNYIGGSGANAKKAAAGKMLVVTDAAGTALKYGTDYTALITDNSGTDGTVTVKVTGKNNFTGTEVTKTERACSGLLSRAKVSLSVNSDKIRKYDGTKQEPEVIVTIGSGRNAQVVPASEYEAVYSDNVYAGRAAIKVHGVKGGKFGDASVYTKNSAGFIIR